jgi:ribonuclease-3
MKEREITALEEGLGYHFRRRGVLEQAVTHSSQAREQEAQQAGDKYKVSDNEQLEFLGDAVLALVTSEELFHRFPRFREGELSKLRAHLVSERHLIRVAQQLELGHYLRLGRGEEKSGGRGKTAVLVDALEAILAAIYLDGGLEVSREFVRRTVIEPELERMERGGGALPVTDFKSALQEAVQGLGLPQPAYVLVEEAGPEHSKTFTVEARLNSRNGKDPEFVGRAQGSTKKTAEQEAARQLLTFLATRPKGTETKPASRSSHVSHAVDK